MGWLSRRRDRPQDPQQVIDQLAAAKAASDDTSATAGDFAMTVEDVFSITGRGTVVTGRVASGELFVDQDVTHLRGGVAVRTVRVTGIEMFRKMVDVARPGDNVGVLLAGIGRHDIATGDQLVRNAG